MEFSDVSPNEWVGVTINASSTEDFLKQLKNTNYEGKDLNGYLVNVDFKKVEEELKDKSPTLGHIFCEDCNFMGCEIVNPYKRGHLSSSCKTDGMEHIKKQLKFLEEDGLHPVVSYTPDNGSATSSNKYNISVVDNKGELFTKFDMTFWGSADVNVNGAFKSSLVSDRQIVRYRNEENPYISLQSVICLCIGMRLHPVFAFDLIKKAGFSLNDSIEHTAYKIILTSMTTSSVRECNDYLRQMGINPISREE